MFVYTYHAHARPLSHTHAHTHLISNLTLVFLRIPKKTGKCGEYVVKCLRCVLYCFEKLIRYLNKNAYIMIGKALD